MTDTAAARLRRATNPPIGPIATPPEASSTVRTRRGSARQRTGVTGVPVESDPLRQARRPGDGDTRPAASAPCRCGCGRVGTVSGAGQGTASTYATLGCLLRHEQFGPLPELDPVVGTPVDDRSEDPPVIEGNLRASQAARAWRAPTLLEVRKLDLGPVPRLPITEGPETGESLDSFLHHLARTFRTSPISLAKHVGMRARGTAGWANRDTDLEDRARLAYALGVARSHIDEATLVRWQTLGLTPPTGKRGHSPGWWQRGAGARFCSACLTENGGRWPLAWYTVWSFVCVRHHRTLQGWCPRCGGSARVATLRAANRISADDVLALNCRCGHHLDATNRQVGASSDTDPGQVSLEPRWTELKSDHRAVLAQRRLDELFLKPCSGDIDHETVPRGDRLAVATVAGEVVTARQYLADLTWLTRSLAVSLHVHGSEFTAQLVGSEEPTEFLILNTQYQRDATARASLQRRRPATDGVAEERGVRDARMQPRGTQAGSSRMPLTTPQILAEVVTHPAHTALVTCAAIDILDSADVEELTARLGWVSRERRIGLRQQVLHGTTEPSQALLTALTQGLRVTSRNRVAQLFAHATKGAPAASADGAGRADLHLTRPHQATMPPEFRARHSAAFKSEFSHTALALGIVAGTTSAEPVQAVARRLGLGHVASEVCEEWLHLTRRRDCREVVRDAFDLRGVAQQQQHIDFDRRRGVLRRPLTEVPDSFLRRVADESGVRATRALGLYAALFMWQTLTGSDPLLAEGCVNLPGTVRARFRRARQAWAEAPSAALAAGIARVCADLFPGEPLLLEWSEPVRVANLDIWPRATTDGPSSSRTPSAHGPLNARGGIQPWRPHAVTPDTYVTRKSDVHRTQSAASPVPPDPAVVRDPLRLAAPAVGTALEPRCSTSRTDGGEEERRDTTA